ncbi:hypothetical protein BO82DRAFT_358713 [Aspergillus uvarum CBS 121591]|uniref:Uncharacterized protein n=1 Tax=Aspergillus uvarum CBS 121591 TaxID=1448315 RepID=A0A319BT97_9EURO|nr:hypothetical protein BO82DRAFT_358713 [Aspergillus uvarum CBS 121591]PYH76846.1 hypothetical protein BO82DRAFT_358713 [Aspergillus uvarum CBS 121591]
MVYVHYIAADPIANDRAYPYFTWIFISADRNTAETCFRILQENKGRSLTVPMGPSQTVQTLTPKGIYRMSPKFWVLQIAENSDCISNLAGAASLNPVPGTGQKDPAFAPLAGRMLCYWMGPYAALGNKPLAQLFDGHEYDRLSGYSFFIRQCGYPNTYWYCDGERIYLSTTRRSRFTVSIADRNTDTVRDASSNTPLIESDHITISWSDRGNRKRIGLDDNYGLIPNADDYKVFSYLDFAGRFSLTDTAIPDPGHDGSTTVQALCWLGRRSSQEAFELCYGFYPEDDR